MTEAPTHNNNQKDGVDKLNETKNLVKGLFQKIQDHRLIPDSAKQQLQNLYEPFLKIALQAPNLFAFENHQSRVFLEAACHISIDWLEVEDKGNAYIKKLVKIIDAITAQDKYDNKAFIGFQADLEKSLVKLRKRSAILQKREKEKQIGQQKIARAKLDTEKLLSEKLSEFNTIPEFTQQILMNEWTNVLVLLHIRNGSDSPEFKSNLKFVDMLLNLSHKQKEIIKLKKPYELLLTIYQVGLQQVAFNKHEIVQKQEQLLHFLQKVNKPNTTVKPNFPDKTSETISTDTVEEKISPEDIIKLSRHQKSDENLSSKVNSKTSDNKPIAESNKPVSEEPNQTSSDDKKNKNAVDYTDIVASLKIGTWFDILDGNGKRLKAKLSWVSPISGKHLFVDAHGLKLLDKTTPELVDGLTDKTIKISSKI